MRRPQLAVLACVILAASGADPAAASTLTYTAINCTGFTLGGTPPNQTLDCVGGVGGTPTSTLAIVDPNCNGFSLAGAAPNQILVCNSLPGAAPIAYQAVSRKVQGASTFDLSLGLVPGE